MSNTTRRRSRTLRLVLAAVALLGIGAAITAAAWNDVVHVAVDVDSGNLNLQGRVTTPSGTYGWSESDDSNNIQLPVVLQDLSPGESREVVLELRNVGSATAYVNVDLANLIPGALLATCPVDVQGDTVPTDFVVPGGDNISWTLDFVANDAGAGTWGNECQDQQLLSGYVSFQATTDAP